jgi:hypothetical protein
MEAVEREILDFAERWARAMTFSVNPRICLKNAISTESQIWKASFGRIFKFLKGAKRLLKREKTIGIFLPKRSRCSTVFISWMKTPTNSKNSVSNSKKKAMISSAFSNSATRKPKNRPANICCTSIKKKFTRPNRLPQRNVEFQKLADEHEVTTYDGWEFGEVGEYDEDFDDEEEEKS